MIYNWKMTSNTWSEFRGRRCLDAKQASSPILGMSLCSRLGVAEAKSRASDGLIYAGTVVNAPDFQGCAEDAVGNGKVAAAVLA